MLHAANVIDVNEATFEKEVIERSHEIPVVVDFWAAWCGPCRMLGPLLERLAAEPGSDFILAKVDVDANQSLAMRYQVRGIPAVKGFWQGQVVDEFVGVQQEGHIRTFIDSLAPDRSPSEQRPFDQAQTLLNERAWSQAATIFQEVIQEQPANIQAHFGRARALLGQGQGCQAQEILQKLIDEPTLHEQVEKLLPLADYLCRIEGYGDKNVELTVLEAQYRQAGRLLAQGKFAPALDGLLEVLRHNKEYRKGETRAVLLGVFELLGEDDPLTSAYRREMASVLF